MIRTIAIVAALAATSLLMGCNDKPSTSATPSPTVSTPPLASSAPPVAAVPIPPVTTTPAAPSETAKDTSTNTPMGKLTKEEESKSMPMAGQVNNHSSTALDAAKKK